MAGFALGINRALLPWKRAGVDYLLCENAAQVAGLRALCRPPAASPENTSSPAASISKRPDRPTVAPQRTMQPSPRSDNKAGTEEARHPQATANSLPARATTAGMGKTSVTPSRSLSLPLERWPDPWKRLLEKTVRAPLLLWSYPELRDDLSGHSSRERSNALRRLFADLKLPKGSHAFWPFAPLYGPQCPECPSEPLFDGQFFHSGVRVLRPRTVLLLCEQIPEELHLPKIGIMQSVIHGGVRFVQLHGLEHLAADMEQHPARHTQLVQFLRTLCQ